MRCYCPNCGTRYRPKKPKPRARVVDQARVIALRNTGMTYERIAYELGCSTTTAWRMGEKV